jgi:hypothetical protein
MLNPPRNQSLRRRKSTPKRDEKLANNEHHLLDTRWDLLVRDLDQWSERLLQVQFLLLHRMDEIVVVDEEDITMVAMAEHRRSVVVEVDEEDDIIKNAVVAEITIMDAVVVVVVNTMTREEFM